MVLPVGDRRPFSMPYVAHATTLVSGITMVARAPWPAPVNKYFVLRKVVATNTGYSQSGTTLGIWDQDLSNTTPVGRGSGGAPLLSIPIAPASLTSGASILSPTMTILDIDACPQEFFQAGVTTGITGISGTVTVSMEFDVV